MKRYTRYGFVPILVALAIAASGLAGAPAQALRAQHCGQPIVLEVHRGTGSGNNRYGHHLYSEDTWQSGVEAMKLGACGREYDLHAAKGCTVFVSHDSNVRRMTNGNGRIESHSAAWVGKWHTASGAHIPSLWKFMKKTSAVGGRYQQEYKPQTNWTDCRLRETIKLNYEFAPEPQRVLRTSPSQHTLCRLKSLDATFAKTHPGFGGYQNGLLNYSKYGRFNLSTLNPNCVDYLMLDYHALTKSYVKKAQAAGFQVSARMIDSKSVFRRMLSWGITNMITNQPLAVSGMV